MKIVTLMENTAQEGFTCEHGLSLYIETEGAKILFDTGATGAFAGNAQKLGIDLAQVDFAVLSHGHYDHGGGIQTFLEINEKAPVYVSQYAFAPHFNGAGKDIGVDAALMEHPRIVFAAGEKTLSATLSLHTMPLPPEDNGGMTMVQNGVRCAEDFRHEQYLLVKEKGRKILFSGCSHKGIFSILRWFQPDVLVGGFHFMRIQDRAFLEQAGKILGERNTCYYTGHCTGEMQYGILKEILGDKLHRLCAGMALEV